MKNLSRHGFVYLHFSNMKEYSEEMEEYFTRSFERLEKEHEEENTDEMDQEWFDWIVDRYSDRKYELTDAYPTMFRSSLLITIYSLIEKELLRLCEREAFERGIQTRFKRKGSDSIIGSAQKYLSEICNIQFPMASEEWRLIDTGYREIRNNFVHNGGRIQGKDEKDEEEKLEKFMSIEKMIDGFRIDTKHGELILEKSFCKTFIKVGEHFFAKLYDARKKRKK